MLNFESNSIESALFHLQNIGLDINEYKRNNKQIEVSKYEELLEWTLSFVRQTDTYEKKVNAIFDEMDRQLVKRK